MTGPQPHASEPFFALDEAFTAQLPHGLFFEYGLTNNSLQPDFFFSSLADLGEAEFHDGGSSRTRDLLSGVLSPDLQPSILPDPALSFHGSQPFGDDSQAIFSVIDRPHIFYPDIGYASSNSQLLNSSMSEPSSGIRSQDVDSIKVLNVAMEPHRDCHSAGSVSTHGYRTDSTTQCSTCSLQFSTQTALDVHAKQSQHLPYTCQCLQKFSRMDCLVRHIQNFEPVSTFPCPYCTKYDGKNAFSRRDHLAQHLRRVHKIEDSPSPSTAGRGRTAKKALLCPHDQCTFHPNGIVDNSRWFFETKGELTNHCRYYHNESPFPCRQEGCVKIGGQGFFREKDLVKHERNCHSFGIDISTSKAVYFPG